MLFSEGFSVKEQLHVLKVGIGSYLYFLTLVEVPGGKNVHKGRLFPVRPHGAVEVIGVLEKSRRVHYAEI